ncbi:MAG: FHA domain-containing protein [Acidobacteriota bacterium]|nr:FHA domain-containing protein [Acidobacteriota bacterium]
MPLENPNQPIKITLDDLASVETPVLAPPGTEAKPGQARVYGNVGDSAELQVQTPEERGSIFLQAWFYLGFAGLLGAFLGWAICEHAFTDGNTGPRWGNFVIIPMVITSECVGFAIAESIVERSARKAIIRGLLALPLGVVLAFAFDIGAEAIFAIGVNIVAAAGVQSSHNPAFWIVRGVAWLVFGAAGGVVYGIVGQSSKQTAYGALGGSLGALVGGLLFDPIAMLTKGGATSRAVGFSLLGMATGIAIGLVESAMKDRWLYVTAGPLAGKQFILYKPRTIIGSDQHSDIYLFKDSNIQAQHAVIEITGARVQLRAMGNVFVSGLPAKLQVLQSGSPIQIGRYGFRYQERQRK